MDVLALGQLASGPNDCFSDHFLVPQRSVTINKGKEVVRRDSNPYYESDALARRRYVRRSWVQIPELSHGFSSDLNRGSS